jgi:hypothetical protein
MEVYTCAIACDVTFVERTPRLVTNGTITITLCTLLVGAVKWHDDSGTIANHWRYAAWIGCVPIHPSLSACLRVRGPRQPLLLKRVQCGVHLLDQQLVTKNPKIKFHSGTKGLLTLMERRVIPFGEWKHANADALQLWKRSVYGFAERAPQEPYVVRVKLVAEHLDLYFVNVLALVRFDSVECFTLRPVLPQ